MLRLLRPQKFSAQRFKLRINAAFYKTVAPQLGLFGVGNLVVADDFKVLTDRSMRTIDYIRDRLLTRRNITTNQTLLLLDSISNELCCVIDVAELCRNIHESDEFLQSAENSFESLSGFIHKLNTDKRVYTRLVGIMNDPKVWDGLAYEEKRFVADLRAEFESEGVHLMGKAKDSAMALQGKVVSFETSYSQNTNNDSAEVVIGPFPQQSNIRHLKAWLENACRIPQRQFTNSESHLICSSDRRIYGSLLHSIEPEYLRRELYCKTYSEPQVNIEALGDLVKHRQLLARSLGFESFAHKFLRNKVLETPENVWGFLRTISDASRAQTLRELKRLSDYKAKLPPSHSREASMATAGGQSVAGALLSKMKSPFGNSTNNAAVTSSTTTSSASTDSHSTVQPWDLAYLTSLCYEQAAGSDSRTVSAQAAVKAYFPLDACFEGLQHVSRALFGISMDEEEMTAAERWTQWSPQQNIYRNGDIKKLVVRDESGEKIGTVYVDLYSRPGKFPNAAQFTVVCGCSKLETQHLDLSDVNNNDNNSADSVEIKEVQQLPVVALVFNFDHDHGAATVNANNEVQPLLSLHDVETLHHEWGHALHSLLSRTRFQHLSGTRGGVDFIEVPSHLFEYFARSPEVVSQWARHHATGEPVPVDLLRDALNHKGYFGAIDLQQQLLFAAADQYLFGSSLGDLSGLTAREVYDKLLSGLAEVQQEYTVLPLARVHPSEVRDGAQSSSSDKSKRRGSSEDEGMVTLPSMNLLNHTHFVSYGGGYYSYLFAKMYAAQIWHKRFAQDPLSRSAGNYLWRNMLIYGSGKDPQAMLDDLAGGPLDPKHYLDSLLVEEDE